MSTFINLTGKRFGRLTVIERAPDVMQVHGSNYNPMDKNGKKKKEKSSVRWFCKCDCGKTVIVRGDALRLGKTLSCGCYNREISSTQYGQANTLLYGKYRAMIKRCGYVNRGIKVCDEWLDKENGFKSFYKWAIANGYNEDDEKKKPFKKRLSLDRINGDKEYSPENCKWATDKIQNNKKDIYITHDGETHSIAEWANIINSKVSISTIYDRYHNGYDFDKIFETPKKRKIEIKDKSYTIKQWSYMTGVPTRVISDRICYGWDPYSAIFTPKKGGGINGVYFVDDNGIPTKPPIQGVIFLTDEDIDKLKGED